MSITLVRKSQIRPLNIIRSDINTTTSGSALITKVIAGTGLTLSSSTGINPGTGDVTIALSIASASVLGGVKIGSGLSVAVDGTISVASVTWGSITGTLSSQTDLQAALNAKYNNPTGTSSQYIDGTGAYQTFPTFLSSDKVSHEVKAGVAINKGQAVYVTSANGTNMIVGLASNASEGTSSKTMGLLDATVSTNGFARVVTEGLLAGLNTNGANAGDPVWLGTGGNLIYGLANKPSAPAHLVFIGIVTRVNANNGEIFVKVQNGFEMGELHDYVQSGVQDNYVISYESSTSLYKPKSIATLLGYTPANDSTVVHKTGNESIAGIKTFSDTTQSTSVSTGAVVIGGGAGIAKNLYVGGNLNIAGNLTIGGTTTTVNAQNLSVSDNMIYLNNGIQTTITNVVGNGSSVVYTTEEIHNYSIGMVVTISGVSPSVYNLTNQTITAVSTNSFTIASGVTGSFVSAGTARAKSSANPDLGFAGGYNDGSYAHAGLFRDATDNTWKFFKGYTPEPDASPYIDTAHASFAYADLRAARITGSSFVVVSGTSNQFLKADGSLDSTAYLSSYTETDTLASVTARGASTSTGVAFNGGVTSTTLRLNGALLSAEASLTLGAHGTDEGGQLILNSATSYTYAAHVDVWRDVFRVLYGSNTASTGGVLSLNLSSRQLILHGYVSPTSFTGTVAGWLAFDASGNVITVAAPTSGGVTSVNAGTGVSVNQTTGAVTVSIGQSVATNASPTFDSVLTSNNGNGTNFRVGDDAWLGDINLSNTIRLKGAQDPTSGYIVFGDSNTTALGRIGTGPLTYGGNTVYHSGNLTNLSQLTNGPGYLTSYSETDTLASVTGRGASTSTAVTFNANVTLGNNADLIFKDLSGTFPTTGKGFDWELNNDGARIYAIQPSSDSIDLVFQLRDNATTNDRFVWHVDDYQGPAFDKYPLIIRGGTEFDLVDSSLYVRGTLVLSNARVLQNVTGNISMFTNNSGYITSAALNGYATQSWVNSQGFLTSVSDVWVNTTGDTMTGTLQINGGWATTYLTGDNVILRKPNYTSGGWARNLLDFQEHDGTSLFQIGGYGSNNVLSYGYLGLDYANPTMRWYADKRVIFSNNVTSETSLTATTYLYLGNSSTALSKGGSDSLRIATATGYVDIGSMNGGWVHFQADRSVYMWASGQQFSFDADVQPYNSDVKNLGTSTYRWARVYATGGDSSQWNAAYGWGNHAGLYASAGHTHTFASITSKPTTIAGYGITDAYTDAQIQNFFNGANAITGYNKSNWDTAYSWGNHASVGYRINNINNTAYVYATSYRTVNYDFTLDPRQSIDSMSIKLWDNYFNNSGLGVDYGSLLDIHGRGGHVHSQFYMDASNALYYRSSPYAGGWNPWQQIWTTGTLTNLNQLINGPGYITGETDTLQSVTSRGASTNTNIWIKRPANKVDNASCTELPSRVEFNNSFAAGASGYTVFHYPTPSVFRIYADYDGNIGGVQPDIHLGLGYLTIKSSGGTIGNVGVGIANALYKLDIAGAVRLTGSLVFDDVTSNLIQHRSGTDVNTLVTVGHGGFDHSGYLRIGGANVATQSWVTSQGYINGYTETDTLNSVTGRGATTSNTIQVGKLGVGRAAGSNESISVENPEGNWLIQGFRSGSSVGGLHTNGGILYVQAQSGTEIRLETSGNVTWSGNILATRSWVTSQGYITSFSETDTLNSVTTRGNSTSNSITVGSTLSVSADGGVGYVASRIWLYSHNNYRGAGVYLSGTTSTWFAGTGYTNFDGAYIISRKSTAGDDSTASSSYRLWQVDSNGSTYQTGDMSAVNVHAYHSTNAKVVAGSWNFDGMLFDSSERPALVARGNYPHLELWSQANNNNHGSTIRFGGYDNGSSGDYKAWNIGTSGSDLYFMDIAYGGRNNPNPHAGIAGLGDSYGYTGAFNMMRFHNNGNIGVGNFGTYGSGDNTPAYKLDVRGNGRYTQLLYLDAAESLNLYGVRGRFTNEYIHLYNKVGVGHPGGWGQGEGNTPVYGLSTYGGINIAYGYDGGAYINTYTRINKNWGGGDFGGEQLSIVGNNASLTLRSPNSNAKWLIHTAGDNTLHYYYGDTWNNNSWTSMFRFIRNGDLEISGALNEQSSLRYKENISSLESITEKVDKLRPVRYNKIGNTATEIGLIAEEVAEVFPEFVNYNAEGQAESLNYTRLSVVLLQTVKELSDKINKLETK